MEGLSKKEKGPTDTDNSVVIVGAGCCKGINGDGKNTIKNKIKKIKYSGSKNLQRSYNLRPLFKITFQLSTVIS